MRFVGEMPSSLGLIAEGVERPPSTIRVVREIVISPGMIRVLISGASSDGRLELFEFRMPPQSPGPALHVHDRADECFTVLEGSAAFRVGNEDVVAAGGQSLVVPRRVPHR